MKEETPDQDAVDRFILEQIDSVPHLEALLLIWNWRPKEWTSEEMAERLFLEPAAARDILDHLSRGKLIAASASTPKKYGYLGDPEHDRLLMAVDLTYRRELIRVSRLIHSKGSPAVRAFARAFRIKKDDE
jgi:hypothetical protein